MNIFEKLTAPFRKVDGGIPKVIHQLWIGPDMPNSFDAFRYSWRKHHVWLGWAFEFWNSDRAIKLLVQHYPRLLPVYCALPKAVQKADLLRYVILHHCGGVYADLDTECVRPFDPLLKNSDFVACYEQKEYPSICNAILCSTPGHPALAAILCWLEHLIDRTKPDAEDVSHVFATTGSLAITPLILANATDRTCIYPSDIFYPFSWAETNRCNQEFPNAFAKHYWVSGWYDEGRYHVDAYWNRREIQVDPTSYSRARDFILDYSQRGAIIELVNKK